MRNVIIALALFSVAFAASGVDMSQDECGSVGESDWSCIAQNGIDFAIVQAWDGGYQESSYIARTAFVSPLNEFHRMRFASMECRISSC